jgi:hypothetical protein
VAILGGLAGCTEAPPTTDMMQPICLAFCRIAHGETYTAAPVAKSVTIGAAVAAENPARAIR